MKTRQLKAGCVAALVVVALSSVAIASPDIDSAIVKTRLWNDAPYSTVTYGNFYPSSLWVKDENLDQSGWANRHNFRVSANGGISDAVFMNDDAFQFHADVTITGTANSEGGLNLSPWWSQDYDGVFMVRTNDGEVSCWGGRLPFYHFTAQHGVTYAKGTTVRLGLMYDPHSLTEGDPATIQYFYTDVDGTTYASPVLPFDMGNPGEDPPYGLWGILNDARLGGYFLALVNNQIPGNWGRIDFENMVYVPGLLSLDIKPGSCPNSFNRGSHGVLPVALLGTESFDVTAVDVSSVTLSRADGIGGSVAPNEGPPGPRSVLEDVATPFSGVPCDCHELGGDGIVDLSMKFKTDEVVAALELNDLEAGALVDLVLNATMLDGTPIAAHDCIRLVPPGAPPGQLSVTSNLPDAWIDVTPLDNQLDGGGFADFIRTYNMGENLTLTADPTYMGHPFAYWKINGVRQAPGQQVVQVTVSQDASTVKAVYKVPRTAPQLTPPQSGRQQVPLP